MCTDVSISRRAPTQYILIEPPKRRLLIPVETATNPTGIDGAEADRKKKMAERGRVSTD